MGHLCIVNRETVAATIGRGAVRTRAELAGKKLSVSQLADLFADALVVRRNDRIFPWLTGVQQAVAFNTVCRAEGRAQFHAGSDYPIVIPLQAHQEHYPGITEASALDLWATRLLWNAIGKKSLGRGRSITHQTELEDTELVERLLSTGAPRALTVPTAELAECEPLTLRTRPGGAQAFEELDSIAAAARLAAVKPSELCWARDGQFVVEKALEAWLCENFDTEAGSSLRTALLDPGETILWAGNYLPFGVAGASIDFVFIAESSSGARSFGVVELKKDSLSRKEYSAATAQVVRYAEFVRRFLSVWDSGEKHSQIRSYVVSAFKAKPHGGESVTHLTYSIGSSGEVEFVRV